MFSTQPQCWLTFSWIELQMLLRCLIHINYIIVRRSLYLLYLCPCQVLGLFMSWLCDLFFIFVFIFIMINRIISWIQNTCSFAYFLKNVLNFWMVRWMKVDQLFFAISPFVLKNRFTWKITYQSGVNPPPFALIAPNMLKR